MGKELIKKYADAALKALEVAAIALNEYQKDTTFRLKYPNQIAITALKEINEIIDESLKT